MTNQEAFYIIGNIPIPTDDTIYDICEYQEAKVIALDCIQRADDMQSVCEQIRLDTIDEYHKELVLQMDKLWKLYKRDTYNVPKPSFISTIGLITVITDKLKTKHSKHHKYRKK